jgi:tetratricopeptide (TPR) repeat protein
MKKKTHRSKPQEKRPPRRGRWIWLASGLAVAAIVAAVAFGLSPAQREGGLKDASLEELQTASTRDPNNPRIEYYLGLRLQEARQDAAAAEAFQRAAQLDPDDDSICVALAKATASTAGLQHAEDILTGFIAKHPKSAPAEVALAQLLEIRGAHSRSYAAALTATQLDPRNADAWQILGTECIERRDYVTAETALRSAILYKPDEWHNYVYLGRALLPLGRGAEAVAAFREAVQRAPGEALAQIELGKALLETAAAPADFDAARQSLTTANGLPDTMPPGGQYNLYFAMGKSYERQDRWSEALVWLRRAEDLEPNDLTGNAGVHFELARAYQALGKTADAARERDLHEKIRAYVAERITLSDLFAEDPRDTGSGLKLARLRASHGEEDTAIGIYRRILEQSPGLPAAQKELDALMRKRMGATP